MNVENASNRSVGAVANMMRNCHPTVCVAINTARRRMGLPVIEVRGDPAARPLQRAAPAQARRPAGAASWPRRPRTRAEHDALRLRADAVVAAARARLRRDRMASLSRLYKTQVVG